MISLSVRSWLKLLFPEIQRFTNCTKSASTHRYPTREQQDPHTTFIRVQRLLGEEMPTAAAPQPTTWPAGLQFPVLWVRYHTTAQLVDADWLRKCLRALNSLAAR